MWSTSQSNHDGSRSCGERSGGAPAVGRHRAVARGRDRHDDARTPAHRPHDLDAARAQRARHELARVVVASLPDEPRLPAERLRPGRHVRRLAARRRARLRNLVVSRDELGVEPDDHVEEEIAEGRQPHAA
jgi:hypothetical protein